MKRSLYRDMILPLGTAVEEREVMIKVIRPMMRELKREGLIKRYVLRFITVPERMGGQKVAITYEGDCSEGRINKEWHDRLIAAFTTKI